MEFKDAQEFANRYYQLEKSGIKTVDIKSAIRFAQRFHENMKQKENLCYRCKKEPGTENPHVCPFSQDLHDDHSESCNCCDDCTIECARDV